MTQRLDKVTVPVFESYRDYTPPSPDVAATPSAATCQNIERHELGCSCRLGNPQGETYRVAILSDAEILAHYRLGAAIPAS